MTPTTKLSSLNLIIYGAGECVNHFYSFRLMLKKLRKITFTFSFFLDILFFRGSVISPIDSYIVALDWFPQMQPK